MPRKQKTEEEKALEQQVAALIKNIKGGDKPGPDVDKAIKLFERAQASITQALAVLRMEEVEEPDPTKKKAGRPRKVQEADLFDSIPPGEAVELKPEPNVRKKKGVATAAAST